MLFLILLLLFSPSAWAASEEAPGLRSTLRTLPAHFEQGTLQELRLPDELVLSTGTLRLSAASILRDQHNYIILPTMLRFPLDIGYTLDAHGYVQVLWLLNDDEKNQLSAQKKSM